MKKVFVIFTAVAFLASCNSSSQKESNSGNNDSAVVVQESVTTEDVVVPDASDAQNSLDYQGTYQGLLPTASGEGMNVTIVLGENDYTKEYNYVGKNMAPTKSKGTYKWNDNGTIITLEGSEEPNEYFVSENMLTQLDTDGNKITGDIASQYILKKQ